MRTLDQGLQSGIYGPRPVGSGPKNEKYQAGPRPKKLKSRTGPSLGHQSTKYPLRGQNSAGGGDGAATYGESEPYSIYMQEHLTKHTKDLLTATKTALTELRFGYPGYIKDGEVRAKREGTDKPILIRSHADIKKIKDSDLSE